MTMLTRTRPRSLNTLQREIDRMFDNFFQPSEGNNEDQSVWAPRTDLVETDENFRIHLDLPGVKREDVTVNFQDNQLRISGERHHTANAENEEYVRVERAHGRFYRAFTLPRTANPEAIAASYEDGVLTVTVPKHEEQKPRRIEIH